MLFFDKAIIENYLLSLKVKPFTILTSNSGTGKTKLSEILQALNDAYATDFSESDRVFFTQIVTNMESDDDLINKVNNNSRENVYPIFFRIFNKQLVDIFQSNKDFYNKINSNPELKDKLMDYLLDYVYEEYGEA